MTKSKTKRISKHKKRTKHPQPKTDWILIPTVITCISTLFGFVYSTLDHYRFNSSWVSLEDAILALESRNTGPRYFYQNNGLAYDYVDGVALMSYYTNKDAYDKVIQNVAVHITDITEDQSPNLFVYEPDGNLDVAELNIGNNGWGETGDIQVTYKSFVSIQDDVFQPQMPASLSVAFPDGTPDTWELSSIAPGEANKLYLFPVDDLNIEYSGNGDGKGFALRFEISAQNTNITTIHDLNFIIEDGKVKLLSLGRGGPIAITYGIWIDTSKTTVDYSYSVQQILPGNQAVCVPMFFVPSTSCTMSIQVEFELDNGAIIKSPAFNHIHFTVPYYDGDSRQQFYDGELIDWDEVADEYSVLNAVADVCIGYPYQTVNNN